MILHVNVARRVATYQKRDGFLVCGNKDYQVKFTFDREWDAYPTKTARFQWKGGWHDQKFDGDTCPVPCILGATEVKVGVYVDEFTTTDAVIPALCSCRCNEGELIQPGETYVNQAAAAVYAAQQAAERAEEAADNVEGLGEFDERLDDLEDDVAALKYVAMDITSFSVNPSTAERGETVNTVTASWGVNKTPVTLTLGTDTLDVNAKSKQYTNQGITANKTWTLTATDAEGGKDSATASLTFLNRVYYGAAAEPTTYDSAFIRGLANKPLTSGRTRTFTVDVPDGQYIYYCVPSSMGECTFTVGVLSGGFTKVATIEAFRNATGNAAADVPYSIYRSNNPSLGNDVTVKVT